MAGVRKHHARARHLAIAGAGITGRVLAWEALRRGYRVTLVDAAPGDPVEGGFGGPMAGAHPGVSWVAAGMLTPNTELDGSPELLAMGRESLALWPALAESLGLSDALRQQGCWVVAHAPERDELRHFQRRLAGLDGDAATGTAVSGGELARRCPELARFDSALHFPAEACVEPARVLRRLREQLLRAGCDWHDGVRVEDLAGRRMLTAGGEIRADAVVDCRGLGARVALPGLRGVRGELLELVAPDVRQSAMVRLMHPRYPLYIVPRGDGRYVIGATQLETDDDGPISVRSTLELLTAAYSVNPAFGEARILASRCHCRPALPDNHPGLGRYGNGALFVNGLYRHGVLLAPLMARRALEALEAPCRLEEGEPA